MFPPGRLLDPAQRAAHREHGLVRDRRQHRVDFLVRQSRRVAAPRELLTIERSRGTRRAVGARRRARSRRTGLMVAFTYDILPSRVVFGVGSLDKLPEEIERLGAHRALVLSTPEQRKEGQQMVDRLGSRAAGLFDKAVMHVPIEIAEQAREQAKTLGADCCVAVGGGSTTGLAKAIALVSTLPILAIPTTYAGSEMTPIWGITESGLKKTGRDPRVLPKTVLYDPTLTISMPPMLSATSGMNSIAHCVEALYSKDANPIISMIAEEGIRALAAGLPVVVKDPANLEARSNALYGAWLGGMALGAVGMALHHKLCHTLGGSFGLPHA